MEWCALAGQLQRDTAIGVHHPNFPTVVAFTGKGDFATIGRPARLGIGSTIAGQTGLVAAIGVHDVNFAIAITFADKSDFAAVGCPNRAVIDAGVIG